MPRRSAMSSRKIPAGPRKWSDADFNGSVSRVVLTKDLDVYMDVTGFREAVTCGKSICNDLLEIGSPYASTCKMTDDQRIIRSSALLIAGHVMSRGGVPESDFVYDTLGGTCVSPGKRIKKELGIICDRLPAVRTAFCTKSTDGFALTVRDYVAQAFASVSIDKESFAADRVVRLKAQYYAIMLQKLVCIVLYMLNTTKAAFGGKTSNNHVRHAVYFLLALVLRGFDPAKQEHFKGKKIYDNNAGVYANEFLGCEEQVLDFVEWMHSNLLPCKHSLLAMSMEDVFARRAVVNALVDLEDDKLEMEIKKHDEELDAILFEQREREQREREQERAVKEEARIKAIAEEEKNAVMLPVPTCCQFTYTRYTY